MLDDRIPSGLCRATGGRIGVIGYCRAGLAIRKRDGESTSRGTGTGSEARHLRSA